MGSFFNDLCRDALNEDTGQIDQEPLNRESRWRTQTGQYIPVCEMGDSHLLNTIRMLRGKSPIGTVWSGDAVRRREWLNVMANEAYHRNLTIDDLDEKDPVHE